MERDRIRFPVRVILLVYLVCFVFRGVEYLLVRTDQTILGEAFLHKLAGIAVLLLALRACSLSPREAGFATGAALKNLGYGLLLGAGVYAAAYGVELCMLRASGQSPSLGLYVTSYSIDGNLGSRTGLLFFLLCIAGNIINVVMEEGVFRGLFLKLAERKYSFAGSVLLSSVLFGLWHIAAPVRSFLDGERSLGGMLMMSLFLVLPTFLGGVKFCLLTKMTGSLWLPMADHFVNNTVVNLLHVTTAAGADELQTLRITIAQTISFVIVLVVFLQGRYSRQETFRRPGSSLFGR